MSEPESAAPQADSAAAPAEPRRRGAFAFWLACGLLAIAGAWGAGRYFQYHAATPNYEPPLDRPVANPPYIQTAENVVERMLELAEVGADDVVYDLGCGDGRIVVAAAKRYGCRSFGFDIDPERVAEARENAKRNGVEELVEIDERDILTLDLSEATVVTMYLLPKINTKLIPQLEQLPPGARVVSHAFEIEGLEPEQREVVYDDAGELQTMLYRFTAPLKRRSAK